MSVTACYKKTVLTTQSPQDKNIAVKQSFGCCWSDKQQHSKTNTLTK